MNRSTVFATVLTLAASAAAPASAHQLTNFPTRAPEGAQRIVMQCESDAATRRSFRREHGARPVFVSADEALRARSANERWEAPRCMTEREHARLVSSLTAYAAVR